MDSLQIRSKNLNFRVTKNSACRCIFDKNWNSVHCVPPGFSMISPTISLEEPWQWCKVRRISKDRTFSLHIRLAAAAEQKYPIVQRWRMIEVCRGIGGLDGCEVRIKYSYIYSYGLPSKRLQCFLTLYFYSRTRCTLGRRSHCALTPPRGAGAAGHVITLRASYWSLKHNFWVLQNVASGFSWFLSGLLQLSEHFEARKHISVHIKPFIRISHLNI